MQQGTPFVFDRIAQTSLPALEADMQSLLEGGFSDPEP